MNFDSMLEGFDEFPFEELETPTGTLFEDKTKVEPKNTTTNMSQMELLKETNTTSVVGEDVASPHTMNQTPSPVHMKSFGFGISGGKINQQQEMNMMKYEATQENELGIIPKAVLSEWVGKIKQQKLELQKQQQQQNVFVDPVNLSSNSEVQALMKSTQEREGSPYDYQGTPSPGHYEDEEDIPKLSKRGRKKKKDTNSSISEEQKKAKRREANRLSAAASRKRKKRYVQDLETTIKTLSNQNTALINHIKENQRETAMLKQMVEEMRFQQQQGYPQQPPTKKFRKNNSESKPIFAENEPVFTYDTTTTDSTSWFEMTLPKTILCVFIFCFVLAIGVYSPATHSNQEMTTYQTSPAVLYKVPPHQQPTLKRHSRQILSVTCKKILAEQADSMRHLSTQVQHFQNDLNDFLNTFESIETTTTATATTQEKDATDM